MAKVLAFEVEIGGISGIVNDLGTLENAIKQTNNELKGARIGTEEYNKLQKQLGSLRQIQSQVRADTRAQQQAFVQSADAGKGSYRALNAELVNLRARFKELSAAEREGALGQEIIGNIQKLDSELKKIDASIGQFQRNVGNYKSALTGLGDIVTGGLLTGGLTAVIGGVTRFFTDSIQVTADFNRQIGLLGAVSGASAAQLTELEKAALDLGSSTEFTASEVAQLEIELAKLGFAPTEILDLLGNSLDTATLSGSELADTARVIGTTLRAFELDASESQRVADVLGKSFSSSALDLDKFDIALAQVGASGNAVGLSLEEVTGLLGTLVNAGFRAETAGTALRNIFLTNAQAGLTYEQAIEKLATSNDLLVASAEEYGKEGAAQGLVLANNAEQAAELTEALRNAEGFTREAAAAVRDDLQGSLQGFSSASEGFQIAVGRSFEGLARIVVDAGTAIVRFATDFIGFLQPLFSDLSSAFSGLINNFQRGEGTVNFLGASFEAFKFTLELVFTILTEGIKTIDALVGAFSSASKEAENVEQSFSLVGFVFESLLNSIKAIPNFISGIGEAVRQLIDNIKFRDFSVSISDAFNRGFSGVNTQTIRSEFDKARESMNQAFDPEKPKEFADAAKSATDQTSKNTDKAATAFEALQKRLADVTKRLQDAILQGGDYSELLQEYTTLTNEVSEAQKRFKEATESLNITTNLADASIKQLSDAVNVLKQELNTATPENIQSITNSLIEAERRLLDAQNEVERARNIASGGTGVIQADIAPQLEGIEQVKEARIAALRDLQLTEAQEAEQRKQIVLQSEIEALQLRTALYNENTAQRLKLETDLATKTRELQSLVGSADINTQITELQRLTNERILATGQAVQSEEQYQERRKVLEAQTAVDIIRIRLTSEQLSTDERLALQVELYDAELNLAKATNEQIVQDAERTAQRLQQTLNFAFDGLNQVTNILGDLSDARLNKETAAIEAKYARELQLAEGNAEAITEIEERKEKELAKIQEAEFERAKKLQILQAVIGGAQAIISTLAAPPGATDIATLGILRGIQTALVIAATAAQIAKIRSQTFAEGGYTGSGTGKPDRTGHKPAGIVHANEYVVPKYVLNSKEGAFLVNRLEQMRKGSARYSPYVDYVASKSGLYATGGFAESVNSPGVPNGQIDVTVMFSDEQIQGIADVVGERVYSAVIQGTLEATEEVATINERRQRLNNNIG